MNPPDHPPVRNKFATPSRHSGVQLGRRKCRHTSYPARKLRRCVPDTTSTPPGRSNPASRVRYSACLGT